MKNNCVFYEGSAMGDTTAIIIVATIIGSLLVILQPAKASVSDDDSVVEQERIAVGGGNMTVPINRFSPAAVEIIEGQSVVFDAPQNSTELHNVIFDMSNGSVISGLELPFIVPQGIDPEQQLALASPFNLGAPIVQKQPDGSEAIIALNKLAFYPSVADRQNNTRYLLGEEELQRQTELAKQQGFFMPPNLSANYTINGTENVVSSGIIASLNATTGASPLVTTERGAENTTEATIIASGAVESSPLPYPFLNSFTVTFEEPGIYEYFCVFHPGMEGLVHVSGAEEDPAAKLLQLE